MAPVRPPRPARPWVPPLTPPAVPAAAVPPLASRRTRDERRADTRERLLDAAAQVFNRLGYHGASLEAVAEAAGFTKGAVYSNFATKQDLFMALLDRSNDARVSATEQALGSSSLEQAISMLPEALRGQARSESGWDLLTIEFWLAAMRDPELRKRLVAGTREAWERYGVVMDERIRKAGLQPGFTGAQLAQLVNAFSSGLLLQYYLDPEGTDLEAATRALRRIAGLPDEPTPKAPGPDGAGS